MKLGLSSSGDSVSLSLGSKVVSSEVVGNHLVVLSHESLLLGNCGGDGGKRISLLLVGIGWSSGLWSWCWLILDVLIVSSELDECWSSSPLLDSWVWVLWVLTSGLSGSSSRDVVSESKGISGVLRVSGGNISSLGLLESLLSLNGIGGLSNLTLEKLSRVSWGPGSFTLISTEGHHVVDISESGLSVVMVVSGRDAEESHKNNGVFHF